MEEEKSTNPNNRMIVILLGVIVVLLIGIVAYVVVGNGKGGTTDTASNPGTTPGSTNTTAAAVFDPATATVVAAGKTPEQHVRAYFDAVVAKDFATAFKLLPTSKQQEYGDEAAFTSQLSGYGITAYTIDNSTESGTDWQVTATATMGGGNFSYLWTFVKDGDKWLVKSRELPGMAQ